MIVSIYINAIAVDLSMLTPCFCCDLSLHWAVFGHRVHPGKWALFIWRSNNADSFTNIEFIVHRYHNLPCLPRRSTRGWQTNQSNPQENTFNRTHKIRSLYVTIMHGSQIKNWANKCRQCKSECQHSQNNNHYLLYVRCQRPSNS